MQPNFQILANQQDITETIKDRLLSLRITDESGMDSDTVEIHLDDREAAIQWPTKGAELDVTLGDSTPKLTRMGLYVVDEVEHSGFPLTMTLRAKAANMRASLKAPKTRSFDNITLGDLVTTIAQAHQLTAKVATSLAAINIVHLDQTNESDLHVLTRLAKEQGAVAKSVAGFLVFVPKGDAQSATGKDLPVIDIPINQISRYRFTQAERSRYQSVTASWHDNNAAEKQSVTLGSGEPVFSLRHTYATEANAKRAAKAKLNALIRGSATLSLTLLGNPNLQAEGKINVTGIRSPINGEWVITRVEHQLDNSGSITTVEAELPNN